MATRISTHSSVGKFHLWNSFLLVQMVIKIGFSSSILFFQKREIDFSQTNDLDNCPIYIAVMELKYSESQYWVIRCLIVCLVFLSFIWCLNISDFVLQITRSKMLRKRRSYSTDPWESPFASALAFTNLLDPVFDIILLYILYNYFWL